MVTTLATPTTGQDAQSCDFWAGAADTARLSPQLPIVQSHKSCRKLKPVADSLRGQAGLAESVDAVHSKCIVERRVGSSPTSGTDVMCRDIVHSMSRHISHFRPQDEPHCGQRRRSRVMTSLASGDASGRGEQYAQAGLRCGLLRSGTLPMAVRVPPRPDRLRPPRPEHNHRCGPSRSALRRGFHGASPRWRAREPVRRR